MGDKELDEMPARPRLRLFAVYGQRTQEWSSDGRFPPLTGAFHLRVLRADGGEDFYMTRAQPDDIGLPSETPYTVDLRDGVLCIRHSSDEGLVRAYAPGGWLEVDRLPAAWGD